MRVGAASRTGRFCVAKWDMHFVRVGSAEGTAGMFTYGERDMQRSRGCVRLCRTGGRGKAVRDNAVYGGSCIMIGMYSGNCNLGYLLCFCDGLRARPVAGLPACTRLRAQWEEILWLSKLL